MLSQIEEQQLTVDAEKEAIEEKRLKLTTKQPQKTKDRLTQEIENHKISLEEETLKLEQMRTKFEQTKNGISKKIETLIL